jgi:L-ascorbate metabolism protein UlaG (beta-lactamase superfamily)
MKKWLIGLGIPAGMFLLLVAAIWLFVQTAPQLGSPPQGGRLTALAQSAQFSEGSFRNRADIAMDMGLVKTMDVMYDWFAGSASRSPQGPIPARRIRPSELKVEAGQAMLSWFGHSAFMLEIEGATILLDPMLGPVASPVSFINRRFDYELPLSLQEIPFIDIVVISHDHYDHLDYESIVALKEKVGQFLVPLGLGSHLLRWGVEEEKIVELDWWQSATRAGVEMTATPAQHFSGRSLDDGNSTLWASWVIEAEGVRIFFSGDSGYFAGFKEIGDRFGPFDLTLMECGQYDEEWASIHMMPEETAQAHLDLRGKVLMPIHWGAFDLALHAWDEPPQRLLKAARRHSIEVITPYIGERFDLLRERPRREWWNGKVGGVMAGIVSSTK